jgi:hypothetical protein
MSDTSKLRVRIENALTFKSWIETRGGIARWVSKDLTDPGEVFTPALTTEGEVYGSPHWKYGHKAEEVITDPSRFVVEQVEIVEEFEGKLRRDRLRLVLTKSAQDRADKKVKKLTKGDDTKVWWEFASKGDAVSGLLTGTATIRIVKLASEIPLDQYDGEEDRSHVNE